MIFFPGIKKYVACKLTGLDFPILQFKHMIMDNSSWNCILEEAELLLEGELKHLVQLEKLHICQGMILHIRL